MPRAFRSSRRRKPKFLRAGSPVNRTEAALMGRGVDRATAARLRSESVASLIRVGRVNHIADELHLTGTIVGIALAFEGLKLRDYLTSGRVRRPGKRRVISI